MKIFGRRKPGEQPPQEPWLNGMDRPHYSKAAADRFIEVIMKASDVQRPGRIGADHQSDVDRAVKLDEAIEKALVFCNGELLARMKAFRDAVIEESMGGGSKAETDLAREHFTAGCRHALGNDK